MIRRSILLRTSLALVWANAAMAAPMVDPDVEKSLRSRYPKYTIERIEQTEVPGLYLVHGSRNLLYYFAASGHLFAGDIWNPQGTNIAEEPRRQFADKARAQRAEQLKEVLAGLPLEKAVRIGNGPKKVIEITDPDCPFCRKGSEFFAARTDVTRYVFFLPLEQIHPKAKAKASYVLAAPDQARAYEEVMSGRHDQSLPPFTENGAIEVHLQVARQLGVEGTPAYWVVDAGEMVSGADLAKLSQLLR